MKKKFCKILILSSFFTIFFTILYRFNVQAMNIEYLAGKDRYETASMIANKMSYSEAILVNGLSLADGLSASGLSGTLNAPILLTEVNSIPSTTLEKISHVKNIYLIGGAGVISSEIESKLKSMGKTVTRLGGQDRYLTSYLVADEINKLKGIQELYYVNGLEGEADAMSIAPVAAKTSNPVILTDGKSTNYRKEVKSYSIGGIGVLNSYFDFFTERISGKNRFETNANVINKFFPDKNHVNLSKSITLIDALTSSALKEPVVLIDNYSDKSIIAGAKSATVFGDINQVAVNKAKSYIYNDTVIFYSQHQDDETLFSGSALVDAIKSVGRENVYVVLITDGDESGVFQGDRYKNLTTMQKAILRNNEFKAAVSKLGVLEENIVFLNQPEKEVDKEFLKTTILNFENNFSSVTHITHSYKYDLHKQHLETGKLMNELYNQGLIQDCRFFGRYNYIASTYDKKMILSVADNDMERKKVLDACYEYKLDNKDMLREGIGYKSVSSLFDNLTSDQLVTSYLHEPGL